LLWQDFGESAWKKRSIGPVRRRFLATVIGTTQFPGRRATSSALALCCERRYISADLPEKASRREKSEAVLVKQTQSWRRARISDAANA
jgi:hypothetical protein